MKKKTYPALFLLMFLVLSLIACKNEVSQNVSNVVTEAPNQSLVQEDEMTEKNGSSDSEPKSDNYTDVTDVNDTGEINADSDDKDENVGNTKEGRD